MTRKELIVYASIATSVVGLLLFIFWPRQHVMTVSATEWVRSYQIEVLKTVEHHGSSWVPDAGRETDSYLRRSCVGTGKDEHCSWVRRYNYEIEEFVDGRSVNLSGVYGSIPRWPDYTLSGPSGAYGTGRERLGSPHQAYSIHMSSSDTKRKTTLPQQEWETFAPGQIVFVTTCAGIVTKVRHMEAQ